MTAYTSHAWRDCINFDNEIEYKFEGRGILSHATWHEPGDSEMDIETCHKYVCSSSGVKTTEKNYDVDKALEEIATFEGKPLDKVVDELVQTMWDNAEPVERDYDDDYDKDF